MILFLHISLGFGHKLIKKSTPFSDIFLLTCPFCQTLFAHTRLGQIRTTQISLRTKTTKMYTKCTQVRAMPQRVYFESNQNRPMFGCGSIFQELFPKHEALFLQIVAFKAPFTLFHGFI